MLIDGRKVGIDDSVDGFLVVQIGDLIHNLSFIGALDYSFKGVLARRNGELRWIDIAVVAFIVPCKLSVAKGNLEFKLILEDNFLWCTCIFKRLLQSRLTQGILELII